MNAALASVLAELAIPEFVESQSQNSMLREIATDAFDGHSQAPAELLVQYGLLYETELVQAWQEARTKDLSTAALNAFACWRSLANAVRSDPRTNGQHSAAYYGAKYLEDELPGEVVAGELALAFRVAVTAVLSKELAECRLLLRRFSVTGPVSTLSWRDRVAHDVLTGFVLLSRKGGGWDDIKEAIDVVERLRQSQAEFEKQYLTEVPEHLQRGAALELVAMYHMAQLVTLTANYLIRGHIGLARLTAQLERHSSRALQAIEGTHNSSLHTLAVLLLLGCEQHAQNSVWTHVAAIEPLRRFAEVVASDTVTSPLVELWPAQQQALQESFLDPYKTAISVQMPTSAGKTLLAKFAIIQAKALDDASRIVYVVPTRALVNQVTLELRSDFRPLGFRVEQAVPAMELDPTENVLLTDAPDVLVTTPEKLDLLVRDSHPCTTSLALVIADEAHNIQDGKRGERLELLLGVIKRDRPNVRFLLLSPFIPNAAELVEWLGESRKQAPILVDWRPANRIVGYVLNRGKRKDKRLYLETANAADNVDVGPGHVVTLGMPSPKDTVTSLSLTAAQKFAKRGTVLVLCWGKVTANTRAVQAAALMPDRSSDPFTDSVCAYIDSEVGGPSSLTSCLRRGVAYHHAGLSQETRWLIESLIRQRLVDIVYGTTTLAQGVNFPISSVIVETLRKGRSDELTFSDFWNIAGRAGRALVDTVGLVAFPAPKPEQRLKFENFLKSEAQAIVSQLMGILAAADTLSESFSIGALRKNEHLSSFLRFLSHAARVAGRTDAADDVEDILRASLLFNQAQKQGRKQTEKLIRMCRKYLTEIKQLSPGVLTLADRTGFATPTINYLLASIGNEHRDFKKTETWAAEHLFGDDPTPLAERIRVISEVPEMSLGQTEGAVFNPKLVASIVRDWVRGVPLQNLADDYWFQVKDEAAEESESEVAGADEAAKEKAASEKRLTAFSSYLFSDVIPQVSWGLGALQGCCLDQKQLTPEITAGFVPSMAYFGVQRKEAVWLRMAGAPRIVAEGLAELWSQQKRGEPKSYQELRNWISGRTAREWQNSLPSDSALSPSDMQRIWREISGEPQISPAT